MQKKIQYLREDLARHWQEEKIFPVVKNIQGEIFRHKEGRRTLRFILGEKSFFLKWHQGVGWLEIIKNLLQLRLPVISAKNEWQAIRFLEKHKLDTMTLAAYGEQGVNPAKRQSFVITDELTDTMSLESVGQQWRKSSPAFSTKINLINKLARISRIMHNRGMNHRDYYLCHFLLDKSFATTNTIEHDTQLFLIDLHRAQIRQKVPQRWLIKDIGSLYFSASDVALTQRDIFRFMKEYSGLSLRHLLAKDRMFWHKVQQRAAKLNSEQSSE